MEQWRSSRFHINAPKNDTRALAHLDLLLIDLVLQPLLAAHVDRLRYFVVGARPMRQLPLLLKSRARKAPDQQELPKALAGTQRCL